MLSVYAMMAFLFLGGTFSQRRHFLMSLLSLELCLMSLYMWCLSSLEGVSSCSSNLGLLVLSVSVCEAVVGLGLLVCRSRSVGTDSLKTLFSMGA